MQLKREEVYSVFNEGRLCGLEYVSYVLKQEVQTINDLSEVIKNIDKEIEEQKDNRNLEVIRQLTLSNPEVNEE